MERQQPGWIGRLKIYLLGDPLEVLGVCDNERVYWEKTVSLKCVGKRTQKDNKENKMW